MLCLLCTVLKVGSKPRFETRLASGVVSLFEFEKRHDTCHVYVASHVWRRQRRQQENVVIQLSIYSHELTMVL